MGYEPKYPDSFKHFDYANPDAPKGGHLTLSASGSFDKLNRSHSRERPRPAWAGSSNGFVFAEYGLVFDSLMTPSEDEPFSNYGLLAEDVLVAPDQMSVTFRLNPKRPLLGQHARAGVQGREALLRYLDEPAGPARPFVPTGATSRRLS